MNMLSVDLYQSATNPEKFLAIPAGADVADLMGPMTFDKDYAQVVRYHEAFQFDPAESYDGVNAAKIGADILTAKWAAYQRASPGQRRATAIRPAPARLRYCASMYRSKSPPSTPEQASPL